MTKSQNRYFIFGPTKKYDLKHYVKIFILFFVDFYFKTLLFLISKRKINRKYYTSICAIFKNESHNLVEWLEFHKLLGIEHIYLYNNFSNDNYQAVLYNYIKDGYVTIEEWPFENAQFTAYEHYYNNYRYETQWVIFLDLDEFITPFYEININEWIKKFNYYPSVIVYWKMFGSSGKIEHDFNSLTIEQYTISWDKMYNIGKSFINTDFDISTFDAMVHHATTTKIKLFNFKIKFPPINEFKRFVKYDIHRVGIFNKEFSIQINHYWSKSYNYYLENKVKRGDVNNHERTIETFFAHEIKNNASDFKIFKYIILLKNKLVSNRLNNE